MFSRLLHWQVPDIAWGLDADGIWQSLGMTHFKDLSFLPWKLLFSKHTHISGNVPMVCAASHEDQSFSPWIWNSYRRGYLSANKTNFRMFPTNALHISYCLWGLTLSFVNGNKLNLLLVCMLQIWFTIILKFKKKIHIVGYLTLRPSRFPLSRFLSPWPGSRKPLSEVFIWNNFSTLVFMFC